MKYSLIFSIHETDENIRTTDDIFYDYNGGYEPDADPADYIRIAPVKAVVLG